MAIGTETVPTLRAPSASGTAGTRRPRSSPSAMARPIHTGRKRSSRDSRSRTAWSSRWAGAWASTISTASGSARPPGPPRPGPAGGRPWLPRRRVSGGSSCIARRARSRPVPPRAECADGGRRWAGGRRSPPPDGWYRAVPGRAVRRSGSGAGRRRSATHRNQLISTQADVYQPFRPDSESERLVEADLAQILEQGGGQLVGPGQGQQVTAVDHVRFDPQTLSAQALHELEREEPVVAAGDDPGFDLGPAVQRPRVAERPAALRRVVVGRSRRHLGGHVMEEGHER